MANVASPVERPQPAPLRVPEGFTIERAASPPTIRFPMFGALDERGRLFITESSGGDLYEELLKQTRGCRISLLQDHDGDGRYEDIRVFAEQLVPSMGLVWRGGKLYVADPPDLITLEDSDGDGRADRRTVLLTGFGHTDNGSLHGLEFGPDGWLYLTMGWPDGYRLKRGDGVIVSGKTGALLRCRPDGSQPERLCYGFDQLIELVFLPAGEILGTQTWYQNPSGGLRDALTHLLPGGQYPQQWRNEEPRPFTTGEALPALLMLPAVAHSGLVRYRGNLFPSEWRGQLFSAQFNTRKVVRHPLIRDGATFHADMIDFITTDDPDFRPADVLEDADGSLLVLDTGSWYVQHCPTGRLRETAAPGAIYRVRRSRVKSPADPRGLKLNWRDASADELARRLGDERWAVRERAIEDLVDRGPVSVKALSVVMPSADWSEENRASAVWALGRIGDPAALRELRAIVATGNDTNARAVSPLVLAAAARSLGSCADRQASVALARLLRHREPGVVLAAAEALAACGGNAEALPLLEALTRTPDRMLEHALIDALHRTAHATDLRAALHHANPTVQKAALLVLDQPPHRVLDAADVLSRLNHPNDALRGGAQFCLQRHPEWAPHAVPFVRQQLRARELDPMGEAALRELLRVFEKEEALIQAVAEALRESDAAVGVERKILLLNFIAQSARLDWPAVWQETLDFLLRHRVPEVRLQATKTIAMPSSQRWDPALRELAQRPGEDAAVRLEALAAIARRQPQLDPAAFEFLRDRLMATNPPLARLRAAEVLALTQPPPATFEALLAAAAADPSISPNFVLAAAKRGGLKRGSTGPLLQYLAGSIERGWAVGAAQLDWVLKAADDSAQVAASEVIRALRNQAEQQRALLKEYEGLLSGGDTLRGRALFFDKASCHTCHQVGAQGRAVGPDLTKVGAIRSGRDILESVLLPSATFAQGFDSYMAELKDGEVVIGALARDTPEMIVLRNVSGAEMRLQRRDLAAFTKSRLSMMPEGLLQSLTRPEAADLLAFLQDLK